MLCPFPLTFCSSAFLWASAPCSQIFFFLWVGERRQRRHKCDRPTQDMSIQTWISSLLTHTVHVWKPHIQWVSSIRQLYRRERCLTGPRFILQHDNEFKHTARVQLSSMTRRPDGLAPREPWSHNHRVSLGLHEERRYWDSRNPQSSPIFWTTYLPTNLKNKCSAVPRRVGAIWKGRVLTANIELGVFSLYYTLWGITFLKHRCFTLNGVNTCIATTHWLFLQAAAYRYIIFWHFVAMWDSIPYRKAFILT